MGKHWNYNHKPTEPRKPTLRDTKWKKEEAVIRKLGTYEELNFNELIQLKDEFVAPQDAKDIDFVLTVEDLGTHGDTEYTLIFKAVFNVPLSTSEIEAAVMHNQYLNNAYEKDVVRYNLQLNDWQELTNENAIKAKEQRREMWEKLKEEFGK